MPYFPRFFENQQVPARIRNTVTGGCPAPQEQYNLKNLGELVFFVGNQPAPYRGLSAPPGPKYRKSLENVSRGLRPRDPKKSPKSPGTLQKHSPDTFRRLSEDFPDCPRDFFETFWGPGAGGPGRHFRDSFGISGPEGPRDLCKGRAGSQFFCSLQNFHIIHCMPRKKTWRAGLLCV